MPNRIVGAAAALKGLRARQCFGSTLFAIATWSGEGRAQAVIPTRPGEPQPLVEVQISNTAIQRDDYIGPGAVRCRIRLAQPYPNDVNVTLSNIAPGAGGLVWFVAGALRRPATTMTLPRDGTWVPFTVRARRRSTIDKDAVIEVREARPDGTVLARKSFAVLPLGRGQRPSITSRRIEIAVGAAETTLDDYLTWSPGVLHLRQVGATTDMHVSIRNMPGAPSRLRFAADQTPWPVGSTATQLTMPVVLLPATGAWVPVAIAGAYGNPSLRDKDAVIEVREARGLRRVLAREGVMVRIRKNANTLSAQERTRFIGAIAKVNLEVAQYDHMQHVHLIGQREAHGLAGFLPWHRVFILELERMLQAMDPSVALHYWRFDQAAPNVFHPSFMGHTVAGETDVTFDATNPLSLWQVEDDFEFTGTLTGVVRIPVFAANAAPSVSDEDATLALGPSYADFLDMEGNPHGSAHIAAGGVFCVGAGDCVRGWIRNANISVRDPLFFLLHSNVDRLWAKWQREEGRFDAASGLTYVTQSDPGPSTNVFSQQCRDHRSFVNGSLWPWNGITTAADTCRPADALGGPFRLTVVAPLSPPSQPTPADVIDYRFTPVSRGGNGFAYNDIPHP